MENKTPEQLRQEREAYYAQKRSYLAGTKQRNEEIMRLRFEEKRTLQHIATRYGLTRQRVKQIIDNF